MDGFSGMAWAQQDDEVPRRRSSVEALEIPGAREVRRLSKVEEVSEKYLGPSKSEPIVVTDAQKNWSRWTIDDLGKRFGEERAVANDRAPLQEWDAPPMRTREVSIKEYAKYSRGEMTELDDGLWYLNSWAPFSKFHASLLKEWSYPYFVEDLLRHDTTDDDPQPQLVDYTKLFLGVPGCRTRLHFDNLQTHAWLAQIQGRKQVVLYAPRDDDNLRLFHWEESRSDTGGEGIRRVFDPADLPDPIAYPHTARATAYTTILEPGDTLLIPSGWWHFALCLDVSVTLMRNFANAANSTQFRAAITKTNDHALRLTPRGLSPMDDKPTPLLRVCANCYATTTSRVILKPCSRCRAVAYCGIPCQKAHFTKHHKAVCKLLADVKDLDDEIDAKKTTTTASSGGHPSGDLFTTTPTTSTTPTKPRTYAKVILKAGTGRRYPEADSMVRVHYETYLADGQKVDSSRELKDRAMDIHLGTGKVARGWMDALRTMTVGEKALIAVPPGAAYGENGVDGKVPPGATLLFDVEIMMMY